MKRCEWCGRFVSAETPVSRWQMIPSQVVYERQLCPDCRLPILSSTPWRRRLPDGEPR